MSFTDHPSNDDHDPFVLVPSPSRRVLTNSRFVILIGACVANGWLLHEFGISAFFFLPIFVFGLFAFFTSYGKRHSELSLIAIAVALPLPFIAEFGVLLRLFFGLLLLTACVGLMVSRTEENAHAKDETSYSTFSSQLLLVVWACCAAAALAFLPALFGAAVLRLVAVSAVRLLSFGTLDGWQVELSFWLVLVSAVIAVAYAARFHILAALQRLIALAQTPPPMKW